MPEQTLAERVRARYPGAYDDLDDATLEAKILAKYPVYRDLATPPDRRRPGLAALTAPLLETEAGQRGHQAAIAGTLAPLATRLPLVGRVLLAAGAGPVLGTTGTVAAAALGIYGIANLAAGNRLEGALDLLAAVPGRVFGRRLRRGPTAAQPTADQAAVPVAEAILRRRTGEVAATRPFPVTEVQSRQLLPREVRTEAGEVRMQTPRPGSQAVNEAVRAIEKNIRTALKGRPLAGLRVVGQQLHRGPTRAPMPDIEPRMSPLAWSVQRRLDTLRNTLDPESRAWVARTATAFRQEAPLATIPSISAGVAGATMTMDAIRAARHAEAYRVALASKMAAAPAQAAREAQLNRIMDPRRLFPPTVQPRLLTAGRVIEAPGTAPVARIGPLAAGRAPEAGELQVLRGPGGRFQRRRIFTSEAAAAVSRTTASREAVVRGPSTVPPEATYTLRTEQIAAQVRPPAVPAAPSLNDGVRAVAAIRAQAVAAGQRMARPPAGVDPVRWATLEASELVTKDLFGQGIADVRLVRDLRSFYGAEETARRLFPDAATAHETIRKLGHNPGVERRIRGKAERPGTAWVRDMTGPGSRTTLAQLDAELTNRFKYLVDNPNGFIHVEALAGFTGAAAGGFVGATLDHESLSDQAANALVGALLGWYGGRYLTRGAMALGRLTGAGRAAELARTVETVDTANLLAGPAIVKTSFGSLSGIMVGALQRRAEGRWRDAAGALRWLMESGFQQWWKIITPGWMGGTSTRAFERMLDPWVAGLGRQPVTRNAIERAAMQVLRPFVAGDRVGLEALSRMGFGREEARRLMLIGEPTSWWGQAAQGVLSEAWYSRMLVKFIRVRVAGLERGLEFTPGLSRLTRETVRRKPGHYSPKLWRRDFEQRAVRHGEPLTEAGRRARARFGGGAVVLGGIYGYERDPSFLEAGIAASMAGPAYLPVQLAIQGGAQLRQGSTLMEAIATMVGQAGRELPQVGEAELDPRRLTQRLTPLRALRRALGEEGL